MQNFRFPYFASGFRDFWRRWHISLSTWFRDYVYIPLGGNRVSHRRWIMNIILTFTLSGLWHGAALTFIIWGFLHGLYLVLENSAQRKLKTTIPSWISTLVTFTLINSTWVFFRAGSFTQCMNIINQLTVLPHEMQTKLGTMWATNNQFREFSTALLLAFPLFVFIEWTSRNSDFNAIVSKLPITGRWTVYTALTSVILLLGVLHLAPQFIYFQF